jgi:hypothetical protein
MSLSKSGMYFFMLKTNNHPNKNSISREVSWTKIIEISDFVSLVDHFPHLELATEMFCFVLCNYRREI